MSKVFFRYNNKKIERHKPLYFSKITVIYQFILRKQV